MEDGLSSNQTRAVLEDREGNIWIGTRGGLSRLKDGKIESFSKEDGLTHEFVMANFEASDGSLWFSTPGGGVQVYRDGQFTALTSADGLAGDVVFRIYESEPGTLWLGTTKGLSRYKDSIFANVTEQNGLLSDVIFQVLEDDNGYFWITSDRGIMHVLRKDVEDFLEGKTQSVFTHVFNESDGLKSSRTSGVGKSLKARDGRLWFPTITGVSVVDPNKVEVDQLPPRVEIEAMVVDGATQDAQSSNTGCTIATIRPSTRNPETGISLHGL